MPWEMPDDVDTNKLDSSFDIVPPGRYHFQVSNVKYDANDKGDMLVESEVIGGSNEAGFGLTQREFYTKPFPGCSPGIWSKCLGFALAVGVTTKEEIEASKAKGKTPVVYFEHAVGRQYCGEIKTEEYTKDGEKKHINKLGYRMWPIGHPKAENIPLNKALLQGGGGQSPDPFGGGGNGGGGPQNPGGDDPFGGAF